MVAGGRALSAAYLNLAKPPTGADERCQAPFSRYPRLPEENREFAERGRRIDRHGFRGMRGIGGESDWGSTPPTLPVRLVASDNVSEFGVMALIFSRNLLSVLTNGSR